MQSTLNMEFWGVNTFMIEVFLWSRNQNKFGKAYLTLDTGSSLTILSNDLIYRLGYSQN